jgi:hypothetical protein
MAGQSSSAGDIRKVMAAKTKVPQKGKSGTVTSRKVNVSKSTPNTIQVDYSTYYLYKGEPIEVDGYQYLAHLTYINDWIGQHDVAGMEYALVDRGANGGVCGVDMLVFEGSKGFVDVSGLAGHTVNQLRIVTAQALETNYTQRQCNYLVKARLYCLAFKWKVMVPKLMIDPVHYLKVYNVFSLMDTNFRWISRMVYLIFVVGNQLKRNLVPYHILS